MFNKLIFTVAILVTSASAVAGGDCLAEAAGTRGKSKLTWLGSFSSKSNAINYKNHLSSSNPTIAFHVISDHGKHRVKSPAACSQVRNQKIGVGCFMPKRR